MTKWLPPELEILKKYYGVIPVRDIMSKLPGRTWDSVGGKAKRLGLSSSIYRRKSNSIDPSDLPQTDDLSELWDAITTLQSASLKQSTRLDHVSTTINTPEPIAVGFLADAHIGALTCKYDDFLTRFDAIVNTPNFYLFSVGDTIDNYLPGRHPDGMFHQLVPPELQKQLIEDVYSKMRGRWLGLVQGCFLGGTKVIDVDGNEKNIESVKIDDIIISDGIEQSVVKTFVNHWDGNMISLNIMGVSPTITLTDNHKIYTRKRIPRTRTNVRRKWIPRTSASEPEWIEASDLVVGDFVGIPRIRGTLIPKFTEEEMYIIGVWLAEGSYAYNHIVFSLGDKDAEIAEKITSYFKSKDMYTYRHDRPERHTIDLTVGDMKTRNMFLSLFGEYCDGKIIPKEFLYYPEGHQEALISGYVDGDGHRRPGGKDIILTTTSPYLQSQIRQILFRLGYFISTSYYERDGKKPYWTLAWRESHTRARHIVDDDYIWVPVKEKETYHYSGPVFNFEVENTHTYEVYGIRVKNCHEEFSHDADDFDWTKYLSQKVGAPNLGFGGSVTLTVGSQPYEIMLRHKYRFNSSTNLTATVKRMREQLGDFDIGCISHHHQAAIEQAIMGDGIDRIFIRPGSFKGADRWARSIGYSDLGAFIPTVVLYPDRRLMIPFLHLEQAILFMESL